MTTINKRDLRYRQQRDHYRELSLNLAALLIREGVTVDLSEHFTESELWVVRSKIRMMS